MRKIITIALLCCTAISALAQPMGGGGSPTGVRTQLTRFGIRNLGATFGLAGGDSGLVSLEFPGDWTVLVETRTAYQVGSAVVHLEGHGTTTLTAVQPDSHHVSFTMPNIAVNDVFVVVIDAIPAP